jgi:cell wall-associated NlpC family hydrolase
MLSPSQKTKVRSAISSFCLLAEEYRLRWHYVESRPFHGFGRPASEYHVADCSAFVSLAFNWAMHTTGIYLPDPLGERYSGIGYTGTELDYVRHHQAPVDKYLVGDLAIFGTWTNTVHTSICRKAGTTSTAVFTSNGHESWIFNQDAPEPTSLSDAKAQQHLVGVFRHPSML